MGDRSKRGSRASTGFDVGAGSFLNRRNGEPASADPLQPRPLSLSRTSVSRAGWVASLLASELVCPSALQNAGWRFTGTRLPGGTVCRAGSPRRFLPMPAGEQQGPKEGMASKCCLTPPQRSRPKADCYNPHQALWALSRPKFCDSAELLASKAVRESGVSPLRCDASSRVKCVLM